MPGWSRGTDLLRRATRSEITRTTFVNYVAVAVTAGTSILIAREIGPSGRGEYGAVLAWFALALTIGELGQSGAVTHAVARARERAPQIVASARLISAAGSLVATALACACAPLLAGGDPALTSAYLLAFGACLVNGWWGPYVYALQAVSLRMWNSVRLSQSVFYAAGVLVLLVTDTASVVALALVLAISTVLQLLVARVLGARHALARGRAERDEVGRVLRYGAAYAASQVPATGAAQYDKAFLSQLVPAGALGQYAVAGTVASLSGPLSTAISSVVFPRLSGILGDERSRRSAENRAIVLAGGVTLVVVAIVAVVTPAVVPFLFGADFTDAVPLVWWLLPAMLLRAISDVIAVATRSRARPGLVTWSRVASLGVGAGLIVPLVHATGTVGAALSLLALEGTMLACSALTLWRLRRNGAQGAADE